MSNLVTVEILLRRQIFLPVYLQVPKDSLTYIGCETLPALTVSLAEKRDAAMQLVAKEGMKQVKWPSGWKLGDALIDRVIQVCEHCHYDDCAATKDPLKKCRGAQLAMVEELRALAKQLEERANVGAEAERERADEQARSERKAKERKAKG